MRDLFPEPPVPGLKYHEELIGPGEEAALIAAIESLELAPFRFQGWTGHRLTRSFGWHYDFDERRFAETEPIPDWLDPLRDRAARLAGESAGKFVHVLVTRYDPGAGIGWHRDRPVFDKVVGISLGSAATLRLHQRVPTGFRRTKLPLEPRSGYVLSGEARRIGSIASRPERSAATRSPSVACADSSGGPFELLGGFDPARFGVFEVGGELGAAAGEFAHRQRGELGLGRGGVEHGAVERRT